MSALTIVLTPLNAVRDAVYARISTDAATTSYTLASEGGDADMPYIVVGPAYKGAGGTDPTFTTRVVVQIDAFATSEQGGSAKVGEMLNAVATAISRTAITADVQTEGGTQTSQEFIATIEDEVLNPALRDPATGQIYAQRFARFSFLVYV